MSKGNCITIDEAFQFAEPSLARMSSLGICLEDGSTQDACVVFTQQVRVVEAVVVQTYAIAASLAKKAGTDLERIFDIWKRMDEFCGKALVTIGELRERFPFCGTPELYDKVLDYKIACNERKEGVLGEIECLKMDLPMGLFPSMK